METTHFSIKPGSALSPDEIAAVNLAKAREWNLPPMGDSHFTHMFALLKDVQGNVQAQGELIQIDGVRLNNSICSVIGIGGVIASQKGKGYGKILMEHVIKYLKDNNLIGLGFTGSDIIGFYEKCGFKSDHGSLKRFVHPVNGEKRTNQTEDCVFYLDSEDRVLEKVLSQTQSEIELPRDPDW